MNKTFKGSLIVLMAVLLFSSIISPVLADDVIDERFGLPIVVYGSTLSEAQKQEVRDLLKVTDPETVKEVTVVGEDIANYINGNPNANLYSSAKIVMEEKGTGIKINVVTPDNITQVSGEMYANALLTAGVEDATVDVVSPVKVSGHSALTGIYKAYDVEGEILDKDRMELANEELGVATNLAEKEGMTQEKVSELLTEIKKAIADQNPVTKEEVEKIVKEQLDKLKIVLDDADRELLNNLFDKMRNLNINFDQVKSQLESLTTTIKDKMDELGLDANFWDKVVNFFKDIFQSIRNLFN